MSKYIYVLREFGYEDDLRQEYAIEGLNNAKAFTKQKLFEDETWVVTHCSKGFSQEYINSEIARVRKKFDEMIIKLKRETWTWIYSDGGSYATYWELKRLEIQQPLTH